MDTLANKIEPPFSKLQLHHTSANFNGDES